MLPQQISALLSLLPLLLTTANPLPPLSKLNILPIKRTTINLQARDDDIFDMNQASLVQDEIRGVKNKYRNAVRYLSGVQVAQVDAFEDVAGMGAIPAGVTVGLVGLSSVGMGSLGLSSTVASTSISSTGSTSFTSTTTASPSTTSTWSTNSQPTLALPSATQQAPPTLALPSASASSMAIDASSNTNTTTLSRRGTAGQVPLTDYISGSMDVLYYGSLSIGTPAQSLTVDFDTGSADLWLPVNCTSCVSQQFNSTQSASFISTSRQFSVEYGSGAVSGILAQENVNIGGTTVQGQYFGAVNTESDDFYTNPNSGVIGMAFSSISSTGKPTYFENLMNNKAVATSYFGFHLARRQTQGSSICIGCQDTSKYTSAISWVPVISQTYWSISFTSFSANANRGNALGSSLIGAIDTGTTLIYVPTSIADAFYAQIPGASRTDQFGQGFYQYPCKGNVAVSLGFNGKSFGLDLRDFNLGKTSSGSSMCVGGVLAVGDGFPDNLAIIGDTFLKSWYSIYDYSNGARVGFAASTNNNGR